MHNIGNRKCVFLQREATHKRDLIGRCYFKKQKLAWEILNGSSKNKIEFKLSNISAIKGDYIQPKKGTLHIKVGFLIITPTFFSFFKRFNK